MFLMRLSKSSGAMPRNNGENFTWLATRTPATLPPMASTRGSCSAARRSEPMIPFQ